MPAPVGDSSGSWISAAIMAAIGPVIAWFALRWSKLHDDDVATRRASHTAEHADAAARLEFTQDLFAAQREFARALREERAELLKQRDSMIAEVAASRKDREEHWDRINALSVALADSNRRAAECEARNAQLTVQVASLEQQIQKLRAEIKGAG